MYHIVQPSHAHEHEHVYEHEHVHEHEHGHEHAHEQCTSTRTRTRTRTGTRMRTRTGTHTSTRTGTGTSTSTSTGTSASTCAATCTVTASEASPPPRRHQPRPRRRAAHSACTPVVALRPAPAPRPPPLGRRATLLGGATSLGPSLREPFALPPALAPAPFALLPPLPALRAPYDPEVGAAPQGSRDATDHRGIDAALDRTEPVWLADDRRPVTSRDHPSGRMGGVARAARSPLARGSGATSGA